MRKHMNVVKMVAIGSLALAAIAGCNTTQSPVFAKSERVDASSIAGTWDASDGRVFVIRETPGGGLRLREPGKDEYTGVLVNVEGRTVIEIPLSDPARMGDDATPVYHYGLVRVSGDTMEHQPLNPAWLTGQQQGSSVIVAAPLVSGTGTVTATDPETMRGLLKKAVNDQNAWGKKETLKRRP